MTTVHLGMPWDSSLPFGGMKASHSAQLSRTTIEWGWYAS